MSAVDEWILGLHRVLGYPVFLLLAPALLLTYRRRNALHATIGKVYYAAWVLIYATGTWFTVTHPGTAWELARDLSFNFLGFSMVIYGVRAITLFARPGNPSPTRVDCALLALLIANTIALCVVAIIDDWAMRVFAVLAVALCVVEVRELRTGFEPKRVLLRRHVRFAFATLAYFLTVVSLLHLRTEIPRVLKWVWAPAIVVPAMVFATARMRGRDIRRAVVVVVAVAVLLGAYVGWEVVTEPLPGPEG